jgi:hypothetical protein
MTVERTIVLILHGLETIQNPYAVLLKGLVQARGLLQLVSGSGKGHNLYAILYFKFRAS